MNIFHPKSPKAFFPVSLRVSDEFWNCATCSLARVLEIFEENSYDLYRKLFARKCIFLYTFKRIRRLSSILSTSLMQKG